MGTIVTLLITVPLVGWLIVTLVQVPRRERRRLADLAAESAHRGWEWTTDAATIRPRPDRLREWSRGLVFREGFSGALDDQWFAVAHVIHEPTDPEHTRRVHATICWVELSFPLNDVRIVPVGWVEDRRRVVGGKELRTGDPEFDERFRVLTDDELLGRLMVGPQVRALLLATQVPWSVTLQGTIVVAERLDRVPRNVEDAMHGVAIALQVAANLTGRSLPWSDRDPGGTGR